MDTRVGLKTVPAARLVTIEELQKKFPKKKNSITQDAVDLINATMNDPEFDATLFVKDMLTYENVMHSTSLSMEEYVDAIRFCAYMQSNPDSVLDAYKRTFSHRESVSSRWNAQPGTKEYGFLTSAASRYNLSPAVTKIKTQAMVPIHLLFAGLRYQAVNVLATEMTTAQYSRDRIAAAKELLAAVKPPENIKMEIDVGVKENNAIEQLNAQLASFASTSLVHLQAGTTDLNKLGSMKVVEDIEEVEVS